MGDVQDFTNFMSAVIDKAAFDKIESYIKFAKESDKAEIISGGNCDDSIGYFVEPTIISTNDPKFKSMEEENQYEICDGSSEINIDKNNENLKKYFN